jgi:hypothetical protein
MLIVGFGRKVIETFEFGDSSVELEVGFFPLFFLIFLFIIIVTVADNFVNLSLFVSQKVLGIQGECTNWTMIWIRSQILTPKLAIYIPLLHKDD